MNNNKLFFDGFAVFELFRLFSNSTKYGKLENDVIFLKENIFKLLSNQSDEKLLSTNQFKYIDDKMTSITIALGLQEKFKEMKQQEIEKGINSHYGTHLYLQCMVSGLNMTEEGKEQIRISILELIEEYSSQNKIGDMANEAINTAQSLEGIFFKKKNNDASLIRFYNDGQVFCIGVSVTNGIEQVLTWFNKDNYKEDWGKGKYKKSVNHINFSVKSTAGEILYDGEILNENEIQLNLHSLINGYKSTSIYMRYTGQATNISEDNINNKNCPYCAEEIKEDARKCKHCGEWLDGSNQPTSIKSILNKTTEFVKEQKQNYEERKTSHLFIPTDAKPLEINGINFYGDYFNFNNKRIEYSDIVSIKYFAEKHSTNFFTTNTKNEFLLFLNCDDNFPLEKRFNSNVVNLSTSSFLGIGSGEKTREKIAFIYEFLNQATFNKRISLYIDQIKKNGYFHYPCEHSSNGFKIFNNGDIQIENNIVVNIKGAFDNKKLEYLASFTSWNNNSSYFNPYLLTFIQSGFFKSNIEIQMLYDKDIFDKILFQIIKTGKVLQD